MQLEDGTYKLSKMVDTRQADQLHGLFRWSCKLSHRTSEIVLAQNPQPL